MKNKLLAILVILLFIFSPVALGDDIGTTLLPFIAGVGLAGGAGVAAVGGGVFGGTIGGVTGFVTGQAMSNVVSGSPIYDNVGMAGIIGAAFGTALGVGGKITHSLFSKPSANTNIQKISIRDLYAGHPLDDKAAVMSTRIVENLGPIQLFEDYSGRINIWDGVRRTARSELIYGNDYVKGELLNPSMTNLQIYQHNKYLATQKKYSMRYLIDKLRK